MSQRHGIIFLDGLPDPEDIDKTVKEPKVGPGGLWFREGYIPGDQ